MQKLNRLGEIKYNDCGYLMKIVKYTTRRDIDIQFEDGYILYNRQYSQFTRGDVSHPNCRTVHGIGYIGVGKYTTDGDNVYMARSWRAVIRRCYSEKQLKKNPTYGNCVIAEEWECFQNFSAWYEDNWKPHMKGWDLDKDILFKGNKIYSPDTCCFVPHEINSLFILRGSKRGKYPLGVMKVKNKFRARISKGCEPIESGVFDTIEEAFQAYKTEKETYIQELANKYKPLLTNRTFQALINYRIEITD